MPNIFISYRREDSAGHTGRLFNRRSEHFENGPRGPFFLALGGTGLHFYFRMTSLQKEG